MQKYFDILKMNMVKVSAFLKTFTSLANLNVGLPDKDKLTTVLISPLFDFAEDFKQRHL